MDRTVYECAEEQIRSKGKGKPMTCLSTHPLADLALEGVCGQTHVPAAFPLGRTGSWLSLVPVWTGMENLMSIGIGSPDRPAPSQWLYLLRYYGRPKHVRMEKEKCTQSICKKITKAGKHL
jgi:hypothetical protein